MGLRPDKEPGWAVKGQDWQALEKTTMLQEPDERTMKMFARRGWLRSMLEQRLAELGNIRERICKMAVCLPHPDDPRKISLAGRFNREEGFNLMMEAANKLEELHMVEDELLRM